MLKCDRCKIPIKKLDKNDFGEPIDWSIPYEQYLCEHCFVEIWDNLMDECCPQCRTHPCEQGRECWINPFPKIMYLCYVAPRGIDTTKTTIIDEKTGTMVMPKDYDEKTKERIRNIRDVLSD